MICWFTIDGTRIYAEFVLLQNSAENFYANHILTFDFQ